MKKTIIVLLVIGGISIINGCSTIDLIKGSYNSINDAIDDAQYEKYKKANTIEGYKEFINKYPNNRYVSDAKNEIDTIIFSPYKEINTIESYNEFIYKYPKNRYIDDARRIIDKIQFDNYKVKNTIQAYKEFIDNYPNNRYIEEAKKLIELIQFEQYEKIDTVEAYNEFIIKYPKHTYIEKAKNSILKIHANEYEKCNEIASVEAYREYISKYPDSNYIKDAQKIISLWEENKLSAEEKEVISLINFARTNPEQFANKFLFTSKNDNEFANECYYEMLQTKSMKPLNPHVELVIAAKKHASYIGPLGLVEHSHKFAENISFGYKDPLKIVLQLLIDDGVPSRGHRRNILDRGYQYIGVAMGSHKQYGECCVITFTQDKP